ncbi:hypothetical protein NZK33_16390 [Cyanobium sp. FGCU-6]|jgi:hypothetical protein|nr:hypothetical protein [Cyanobium sp. FGCU6]
MIALHSLPARVLRLAVAAAVIGLAGVALAAPFSRTLSLQGVTYTVEAKGEGSMQQLTVQARRNGKPFAAVREEIEGRVIGAEIEDLNSDGQPDLFVYVQSAGSGSFGSVRAWTSTGAGSLLPIRMQEMGAREASGYMGHDQYAVVETRLVRRFPVYRPGDSNSRPTGGTRQLSYKLVPGEAMWQLRPVDSTTY